MCRDLLFHEQECQFTLPEIQLFLNKNNLSLIGFFMPPKRLEKYRQLFPDDIAAVNLKNLNVFETDNPDTFIGMYQFWVQKK